DKVVRSDGANKYEFEQDTGLSDLVRGLLTPILLFSPVFLWGLPIIQSIAYDRENKVLEVLFSTPIDRKRILLSKVLANMLFILIVGALWVGIVYFSGFRFYDPLGVFFVLLAVSFLMVAMNALVSSISRNVQEATLASSISSTMIFTALFLITMLRIIPQTQFLAEISPATYIARQVTEAAPFPIYPVAALLIIGASALILALSAFSTEAFAFSVKPGIKQLYEGMIDILGGGYRASIGMGFVAFSLTTPVQFVASALLIFTFGINSLLPAMLLILLALVEEFLKGIGTFVLKPNGMRHGLMIGALIGLSYGFGESLLFVPAAWVSHSARLIIVARVLAMLVHIMSSAVGAAVYAYGRTRADKSEKLRLGSFEITRSGAFWLAGIAAATAIHASYNYLLPWIYQEVLALLRLGII
ncbi:MAG: ABC transporter permease, partial [Candidatus Micrarchaeota archaeon]